MNRAEASKLLTSCFDSWYPTLVRYAHGVTGELSVAEDLVQEVFLRFYREIRQGFEIEKPKAWMFCVLRNDIAKHIHRGGRENLLTSSELESVVATPPAAALGDDLEPEVADVERLFDVLTTREQEVLLLRLSSLKYREIADRLDISPSTVNALLARAVRKLRRAAKEQSWNLHADVAQDTRTTLQ